MTLSTGDWGTGKSRCRLNVAGFLTNRRPPPPSDPHRCAVAAGRHAGGVRVPASWMGLKRARPCSILGPCYGPSRLGSVSQSYS